MEMSDSEFLFWLRERMIFVYGESANVDYLNRLSKIIEKLDKQEREEKYGKKNEVNYYLKVKVDTSELESLLKALNSIKNNPV